MNFKTQIGLTLNSVKLKIKYHDNGGTESDVKIGTISNYGLGLKMI